VVQAANLKPHLAERQVQFVDLNRDELVRVKLKANYSGLEDYGYRARFSIPISLSQCPK
jgi:hypothetical protein